MARKANAVEARKPQPETEIERAGRKVRAMQIVLANGREIYVREPKASEFSLFLRALPAFQAVSEVINASRQAVAEPIIGLPMPEMSEQEMGLLHPLLARLSDLTVEEVADLPLFDWMGLFMAMQKFIPKNSTSPTR